jgi:hypothetical protein
VAGLEDIDLNALSGDELVEQMHNDLYDGMREESSRAAVDFGRSARSATSVTPIGPSASAPRTAKARSMDWTLDIGTFVG